MATRAPRNAEEPPKDFWYNDKVGTTMPRELSDNTSTNDNKPNITHRERLRPLAAGGEGMERWWGASETPDALETVPWIDGEKEDIDAPFPSSAWKDAAAEATVAPRGDGDETEVTVTALASIVGRPSSSSPCTSSRSCRSSLGGAASRLRGDMRCAAIVGTKQRGSNGI
jgi:hypothetical protein